MGVGLEMGWGETEYRRLLLWFSTLKESFFSFSSHVYVLALSLSEKETQIYRTVF